MSTLNRTTDRLKLLDIEAGHRGSAVLARSGNRTAAGEMEQPYRVAETYDRMTEQLFPYRKLAAYILERLSRHGRRVQKVIDVGCGTGNLTLPLAATGVHVTGLDVSAPMLEIAASKALDAGLKTQFVCQDMCDPYVAGPADAITCFYGVLNFLDSPQLLQQAFRRMHDALPSGGLLAFDFFGPEKLRLAFSRVQRRDYGDFYAVTDSECTPTGRITHKVDFFLQDADGRYRREREQHQLRIHTLDEIKRQLDTCRFTLRSVEEIYGGVPVETLRDVFLLVARKRDHRAR